MTINPATQRCCIDTTKAILPILLPRSHDKNHLCLNKVLCQTDAQALTQFSHPMLTIRHKHSFFEPRLPHAVFLDGLYAGMIGRDDTLRLNVPRGRYEFKVQFGGPIPIGKSGKSIDLSLSSTEQIDIPATGDAEYVFHDRERLWNILFDIDLIAWVVSWFVTMPTLYKIVSNAFFVLWLLRLVLIRKRYYKIVELHSEPPEHTHRLRRSE